MARALHLAWSMKPTQATAIDLVEAAYNLELSSEDWLPNLMACAEPSLNQGLGCAGAIWAGAMDSGQPLVTQVHVEGAGSDLGARFAQAAREVGAALAEQTEAARAGGVRTLATCRQQQPRVYEALTRNVPCEDALGIWALDPDLKGLAINAPSPEAIELTPAMRSYWQMIAVHLAAAHRLRRALGLVGRSPELPATDLPLRAEAVVDPCSFSVAAATGEAMAKLDRIREAVVRIDRVRGRARATEPERALRLWQGLVRGRWSMVDWFDSDGRRFVLAIPNAPRVKDPRGLTEQELQVVRHSAHGESNKLIGYCLGLSPQRVSSILRDAKRKLGVKTQPQLVMKLRGLETQREDA